MPKYLPDDDEGDIRVTVVDLLLGTLLAVIVAPGVIWWVATFIAHLTGESPL